MKYLTYIKNKVTTGVAKGVALVGLVGLVLASPGCKEDNCHGREREQITTWYGNGDRIREISTYVCGKPIKTIKYDSEGNITETKINEYDSEGNLTGVRHTNMTVMETK